MLHWYCWNDVSLNIYLLFLSRYYSLIPVMLTANLGNSFFPL